MSIKARVARLEAQAPLDIREWARRRLAGGRGAQSIAVSLPEAEAMMAGLESGRLTFEETGTGPVLDLSSLPIQAQARMARLLGKDWEQIYNDAERTE